MRFVVFLLACLASSAEAFPVKKCINLGNALDAPNEGDWDYRIERDHLTKISAAGFDTIRLPVKFSGHWDGRIDPAFLARVDEVIGWAREDGLQVILDLHHFSELNDNPSAHAATFIAIWNELALHFQGAPEDLIFELLNEPNGALTSRLAVDLYEAVFPTIRAHHPDRWIVIEGGNWAAADEMGELPVFDDRTVHNFHFYLPFDFTHQQAPFVDQDLPPRDWGSASDRDNAARLLDTGLAHRVAPVLLGEFGVYRAAPEKAARDWLAFVREAAEDAGIGWCAWSFGGSFAVFDTVQDRWIDTIFGALIPAK